MPCPRPFNFSHSVHYIYDFCPLPDPDVGPSIFVCDVEHTFSILVCAAASLLCACLVSVQVSEPYVIAGSTQELYTGLSLQADGKAAFDDIPVFSVCRPACHDYSKIG